MDDKKSLLALAFSAGFLVSAVLCTAIVLWAA